MSGIYTHHLNVTANEIDELGHAGNYHFIKWMQHAAVAHSTANGWPPARYRELGAGWVVRSHQITYFKPAYLDEPVRVETWVSNFRSATSLRCYEIVNAAGDLLARAETDWAFVSYANGKPLRIPREVANDFQVIEGAD